MLASRIHHGCVAALLAFSLSACDSSAIPFEYKQIESYLTSAALEDIEVGDGSTPITQGNWPRFPVNTTWNWQLKDRLNMSYDADVYVVDMFTQMTEKSIEPLQALGRQVICYFSVGTYEPWMPDASLFSGLQLGNPHISFPGEFWLDINHPDIATLMANRLDIAVALGCDGVELNNIDAFANDTGFTATQQDTLTYARKLANEAHRRGLAVALKNSVELVNELVDYFDLVINDECFQNQECEGYLPFIDSGKPVFNAEYTRLYVDDPGEREALCSVSRSYGFQTLILPITLDGSYRYSC